MFHARGIPDLARERAVSRRIHGADRTHTNWKSAPSEWIILVYSFGAGCGLFRGQLVRMCRFFSGHQEYLVRITTTASAARRCFWRRVGWMPVLARVIC